MNEQDAHILLSLLFQLKTDIVWTADKEAEVNKIREQLDPIVIVENIIKERYGV